MLTEILILNLKDQMYHELSNYDDYVSESNALYKGVDQIQDPIYKTKLCELIKTREDIIEGVNLNRKIVDKRTAELYRRNYMIDNEIYTNIHKYLVFLIKKEIDLTVKHHIRLSDISQPYDVLTDVGFEKLKNDYIPRSMRYAFNELDKFTCDCDWRIYSVQVNGFDLIIKKNNDFRIMDWERIQEEKKAKFEERINNG